METLLPFERFQKTVVVKKQMQTNSSYGTPPSKRSVEELINFGVINLDKPQGPSSHQASAYVKQILGIKKAGHSGTLDPNVTGVLPVALGRATRITEVLLSAGKEYVCLMQVHRDLDKENIKSACMEFVGNIAQLPPVKSSVVRKIRKRNIYYINILDIEGRHVLFKVGCQAGTYIRKLVSDIGLTIGGAHMLELRRTKAGPFIEENSATLHDLKDSFHYYKNERQEKFIRSIVNPIESAVKHLPKIWVLDGAVDSLCHGISLKIPGISKLENAIEKNDLVAIMTLKEELICYGKATITSKRIVKEKNGVAVKPNAVFMDPGTYPNQL